MRRRLRRHKHRLERIKNLLINKGLITLDELSDLYNSGIKLDDIYKIRYNSLFELLNRIGLSRLLIHLAQRRGFKSNRKSDSKEKEAGKLLEAVKENEQLLQNKHYSTVGEMLYIDAKFAEYKRNKSENYSHTIDRNLIINEIKLIFETQRTFGNKYASEALEAAYLEIFESQRPFDVGPGKGSPYAGDQIEKMIGKCTFETDKPRAVKASYTFQYFNLLQKINHIRIISSDGTRCLLSNERDEIIKLAHKSPSINYTKLRGVLRLTNTERFSDINYGRKSFDDVEDKVKFNWLPQYHEIRTALDKINKNHINTYTTEMLNALGYALTVYKSDDKIIDYLQTHNIPETDYDALLQIGSFNKTGNLSVDAYAKIIPHLENGLTYDKACEAAGYNFRAHSQENKSGLLPSLPSDCYEVTNPVVKRAISQTIKVVNSIIRKYGSPAYISIELAREMSKNRGERNQIKKDQDVNASNNERIMERLRTEFKLVSPSGIDLVKFKLWQEQDGICPYSLETLEVDKIFDTGYADIDHIIPYSVCFDDGYKNKVLVKAYENRQKGNRLPLQYLTKDKHDSFEIWVNHNIRDYRKRERLLKKSLNPDEIQGFKDRNLQDTQFISRFMLNYIRDNLTFAHNNSNSKKPVIAVNGVVTSYMRKRWGISKVREDGDLHHAVDAVVVACITDGIIIRVSEYSKRKETEYMVDIDTGEVVECHHFPEPWDGFRKEIIIRLENDPQTLIKKLHPLNYMEVDINDIKPLFVSRMPRRSIKGAAHKETIKSPKILNEGYVLVKRLLMDLKLKDGEIDNYYNPSSDTKLYNALKHQLTLFDGDAKKAFIQPFYKPTSDGKQGPLVKKVKLMEKSTLEVSVHNGKGVADNDNMVRVDVFHMENEGYYLVPIYVADTLKEVLPDRAIIAHKSHEEWKQMDDNNFIFSLYPNDLIKVTARKDINFSLINANSTLPKQRNENKILVYYKSVNISSGSLFIINHDNTYCVQSLGAKTLVCIEKYQIDVLGNYTKVNKERRLEFNKSDEYGIS